MVSGVGRGAWIRKCCASLLFFSDGGFWLYDRVLEAGTFEPLVNRDGREVVELDTTELSMLLSGVSLIASRRRRKRYQIGRDANAA